MSQVTADIQNPMAAVMYPATKKFNQIFGRRIYYPRDIYHLILKPGFIFPKKLGNFMLDTFSCNFPEEAAAIVQCSGNMRETYGHTRHLMFMMLFRSVPDGIWWRYVAYKKHQ